jgi:farnesyl diphosphate synthase
VNKSLLAEMQNKKTGKLFSFCCGSSAIIKEKKLSVKRDLNQIGLQIGLLYQISDDLIDVRGNSNKVGKSTNKDIERGKATLINLLGYDNALEFAYSLKNKIVNKIKKYGTKSRDLLESLEYIIHREV